MPESSDGKDAKRECGHRFLLAWTCDTCRAERWLNRARKYACPGCECLPAKSIRNCGGVLAAIQNGQLESFDQEDADAEVFDA